MASPSYPAARIVAKRLEQRIAGSATKGRNVLRLGAALIEEIITTAFWASLRREEGRSPRISLAFMPPEESPLPLRFNTTCRLEANLLARLAPAVEKPGMHIGVWSDDKSLHVWGVTRTVPTWCFILEVVGPGLLVVKYRRDLPSTKFANIAVLEGAEVKFIEQQPNAMEAPPVLGSLLAFYSSAGRNEADNLLVQIAMGMRAHGRGGTLLVIPKDTEDWLHSIVQPITHSLFPFSTDDGSALTIQSTVDALAGLTAVDGATVISDELKPLAFGAKILSRDGVNRVDRILLTEPIEGIRDTTVDPALLGGTRHLSAAQFAYDQHNAIALVASQDGHFTVFAWSSRKQMVHAHRLETLLL
jgi:hypothetical protein